MRRRCVGGARKTSRSRCRKTSDGVTICAIIADEFCEDEGVHHHGRWNDDYNGRRVNFTVRVPKGVKVGVGSGNGDVSVSGATAEVRGSGNGRSV